MTNPRAATLSIRFDDNRQRLTSLRADLVKFKQEFVQFKAETQRANAELERLAKTELQQQIAAQKAGTAVKQTTKALQDESTAAKETTTAIRQLNTERDKVKATSRETADDRFSRVSNDVGLFGDTQSNLGALRGLAGAAGSTGLDQSIGIVGELFALGEELPRLKTAIQGLPEQAALAAETLGTTVPRLGLLGAGVVALGVAVAAYNAVNDKAAQSVRNLIATQENFYRILLTGNQEQIQNAIEAKQQEIDITRARIEENKRVFEQFEAQVGGAGRALADVFNIAGAKELREETQRLEGTLGAAELEVRRLQGALNDSGVVTRTLEEQERALAQARQAQLEGDQLTRLQVRLAAEQQSSEQIEKRIEQINREIALRQETIVGFDAESEIAKRLNAEIRSLIVEQATLRGSVLDLVKAREAETNAIKEQEEITKKLADTQQKFNDDTAALEQRSLEERQRIQERYADKLIDIARSAADAADNALRKLEERRASLLQDLQRAGVDASINLERERLDTQIASAREQAKNARALEDQLVRIRREGSRSQSQAVADRNSVALQEAQQQQKDQLRDAVDGYSAQERERQIALAQELRDQQTQYQRERQDRQRKYQQDLADAQAQYQQELILSEQRRVQALAQLEQQNQRELAALQAKESQQTLILQNQYRQQVVLASQGSQALIDIEARKQAILAAQARAYLASYTAQQSSVYQRNGTTIPIRPYGGTLTQGQGSIVNDRFSGQQEGFTSGNNTIMFPGGMGMFTPFKAGRVTTTPQQNSGGGGATININLDGKTIQATSRKMAIQAIDEMLTQSGVG